MNGLVRSETDRWIAGVAGGLADRFGIGSIWIRLAFIIAVLFAGTGLLFYVLLWIIIPQAE